MLWNLDAERWLSEGRWDFVPNATHSGLSLGVPDREGVLLSSISSQVAGVQQEFSKCVLAL